MHLWFLNKLTWKTKTNEVNITISWEKKISGFQLFYTHNVQLFFFFFIVILIGQCVSWKRQGVTIGAG